MNNIHRFTPSNNRARLKVTVVVTRDGVKQTITTTGQKARTLVAFEQAATKGITALDVSLAGSAFRLAAYVWDLRNDHGLNIVTENEEHLGGFHARYFLLDQVDIIEVIQGGHIMKVAA